MPISLKTVTIKVTIAKHKFSESLKSSVVCLTVLPVYTSGSCGQVKGIEQRFNEENFFVLFFFLLWLNINLCLVLLPFSMIMPTTKVCKYLKACK